MSAPDRPCGDCQICCEVMAVAPLSKPPATRCPHQSTGGCAIYAERPPVCRGFACSWAVGDPLLPKRARPDLSGVMVWWEGEVVRMLELRAGALDAPLFREALGLYTVGFTVRVERADGRRQELRPAPI